MKPKQLVENIMASVQGMTEDIFRGWENVKALYIKTDKSIALPMYTSLVFKDWEKNSASTGVDNTDIKRCE